jgi:hypothetical protein
MLKFSFFYAGYRSSPKQNAQPKGNLSSLKAGVAGSEPQVVIGLTKPVVYD